MRSGFLFSVLILTICTIQIGGLPVPALAQNNGNTRQKEEPEGLSQVKHNLVLRAEVALTQARVALNSTDDEDAAAQLEKFAGEVEAFETAVYGASSLQALEPLGVQLKELEAQSIAIIKGAGSKGFSVIEVILLVGSAVASLTAFASIGAFVLSRIHSRSHNQKLDSTLLRCTETLESLQQDVSGIHGHTDGIKQRLANIHHDLTQHIAAAKTSGDQTKTTPAINPAVAVVEEPEVGDQGSALVEPTPPALVEPAFPALVADYLSRIGDTRKKSVEADFRTNTLVQTADGRAPFMLVADSENAGVGIVLPKPRLRRGQEFSAHYKGYYHCTDPCAGDVYVLTPATVEQSGSGWRLCQMGSMEIR